MNLEKESFDDKIGFVAVLTGLSKYKSTHDRVNTKQFRKLDVNAILLAKFIL